MYVNIDNLLGENFYLHVVKPSISPNEFEIAHNNHNWNKQIVPSGNELHIQFYKKNPIKKPVKLDSILIDGNHCDITKLQIREVEDPNTKETVREMVVVWGTRRRPGDPPANVDVGVKE